MKIIKICLLIIFMALAVGCDQRSLSQFEEKMKALGNPPKGEVSQLSGKEDVGFVKNEPDYGFKVTFSIRNVGAAGTLTIIPRLSCSEGEWERSQNLYFEKGEVKELSYFFHEPSINATNVEFGVKTHAKKE